MNCAHAETLIQAALDGALTGPERADLDAHLARCPACRAAWDEYHRLARLAADWTRRPLAEADPGDAFTEQVLARIAARPTARPAAPRFLWLMAGLACLLLVALSVAVAPLARPPAALLPLTGPPALLPPVPSVMALPADLAAFVRDLPGDLTGAWRALTTGVAVPSWALEMLLVAVVLNALFFLRAVRPPGRRFAP